MANKNHAKHTNTPRGQNTGVLTDKRTHKWLKIKYFKHCITGEGSATVTNRGYSGNSH